MIHPFTLLFSAGLSFWLAHHVQQRHRTPGSITFVWLLVAIATWCLSGAGHWAAESLEAKLAWSRLQYFGVASVPALSLTFALQFAGSRWTRGPGAIVCIWTIPVLTVLACFTNGWHGALWASVRLADSGRAVYEHGWWFWTAAGHAYALMLAATVVIVRALRKSPPPYRGQFVALLAGAVLPWAGNLAYVTKRIPVEGLDITPLMFAASGALFTYALYRNRLFDLVPVAREQLVDSLSDAVIVLDASQRVLDMNAAASRLVAQNPRGSERTPNRFRVRSGSGDAAGKPEGRTDGKHSHAPVQWFGRTLEELLPFLTTTPLQLGPTPTSNEMVSLESPGGETHYYDVRVTPVHTADARLVAWAVLLRDITEQRRAQAEREAFEQRVQEQQKRESLSVLAGGLAHDFNNLLAGILGNADLLAMQVPRTGDMPAHVGAIILGAQRAADLVSKMLAYAGERHGASEMVDLDELIREMLGLLEASVARHCTLQYEGTPVRIFADPVQIRQVAMNLIINAAEAVDEAQGVVTVRVGTERLSAAQLAGTQLGDEASPGTYACLEVRDNGPGMDESTLGRIFTPFYTTKATGHGLGLAAVHGIVRGHRGALRVETRPGQGTRFAVWLPVVQASGLGPQGSGLGQRVGVSSQESETV